MLHPLFLFKFLLEALGAYHSFFVSCTFCCKHQQMIAAGNTDLADFVRSLCSGEISIECIDDAVITATMAADSSRAGVDDLKGAGVEIGRASCRERVCLSV